jgi:hypothetical protein
MEMVRSGTSMLKTLETLMDGESTMRSMLIPDRWD